MHIIKNETFQKERDFYEAKNIHLINCTFKGEEDGESAFKEAKNNKIEACLWDLRYPFWHDDKLEIVNSTLTPNCRAALWYSNDITILNSNLHGIKALRECKDIIIKDCDVISPEFGWKSENIKMENTSNTGEYFMFQAKNLSFDNVSLNGKYSFQYIENSKFTNCNFNTKDAFWHAKNITVENSIVKGEYLAWYSENITFINCKIIGTQPLCYCKGLKLINCEMIDCDLSFEKSEVEATITSSIDSVKNPLKGFIEAIEIKELILDTNTDCKITTKKGV